MQTGSSSPSYRFLRILLSPGYWLVWQLLSSWIFLRYILFCVWRSVLVFFFVCLFSFPYISVLIRPVCFRLWFQCSLFLSFCNILVFQQTKTTNWLIADLNSYSKTNYLAVNLLDNSRTMLLLVKILYPEVT